MNTHKNANKQGEKILLGGVAAAALGLINAKPQTVKAANQNGNRATKKTASRAVKTKLTYQNETGSETEGETATNDDPTGQNSGSQTAGSENSVGTASSNLETGQDNYSLANKSNQNTTINNVKADKQEFDNGQFDSVNASRESNVSVSSTWNNIPVTFNNGILSIGKKSENYSIDNSANNDISISQNISSITPDDITKIDINASIAIIGSANGVFKNLKNITSINGLDKLDTSQVTSMQQMFASCPKLIELDLSSFSTDKVTNYTGLFVNDTNLTSINLSNFTIADDAKMLIMFRFCSNLKKLVLGSGFKIPEIKGKPDSFLPDLGTWVNMGVDEGSPAKGTNKWSSADLMTKYQGSTDHDTYVCFANLGGTVTVHYQDEDGKQLVDQNGKQIPDEKLFGNISDPVSVDTSKEIAGYKFKENKNSDITAFTSDPQDITLVYSKSKTDNTWEGVPFTFNNGVLSLGEKDKTYTINNSDNKDISISQNIKGVNVDEIKEIDLNAPIAISGSAQRLFSKLSNLVSIKGLKNLNTSQVTDMTKMFFGCTKIVSLDLSSFDTTKVTSFNTMFASDPSLTSIDLSSFTVADDATTMGMFVISEDDTPSLSKLILGKGFKFTTRNGRPNNSLNLPGTWVNMGEGDGSLAKGTNQWSSADLMTNYRGDRDHDTYVRYTGGIVTVHRQDEEGKQLVDQDGKEIPDEKLFGNISDSVTVDTSKEFAGYTFKENQNPTITAFISDPQTITLVYSKSKTDNTWEGVPYTFNNGVLSLGEKDKTYTINNSDNKDISISQNIKGVNVDEIKEIDLNAPIAISGSAQRLFSKLSNLVSIKGLKNLNTSQVTDMTKMFFGCTKIVSLDLSSFDTTKVTSFNTMFASDPSLTSIDLSSFTVADDATTMGMFVISEDDTPSLSKLILGKGFKFTTRNGRPNNSLNLPGTWVNMGEGDGSLAKGTNHWSSADFMTKYQGDRDHDTYVRYTGGTVTVHRQDEEGKQLVDQDGKEIPDEKLFGNISDPVTVDTSKEFAGYTFNENQNLDVKAFISDPQTITLVYSKSKTDNTSDNTWEGVPYTFNNGVLSLGEKGKTYAIDNSGNKEKSYTLDTRDISLSQNIKGVNVDDIKEIDLNANIAIKGSANGLFKNLKNLATIKGLNNLDTSQVTDFSLMFSGDTALTSADLSNFQVAPNATMTDMFSSCSSLTKLTLGTGFEFTTLDNQPNNSLQQPGTWVNMGEGEGSPAKGTNKWTSAELMKNYRGDRDHDTYTRNEGSSGDNGSGNSTPGNNTPNTSVPNNTNSSSGNNGSVNNPSSSNSQGSNSQGSNTGNSNNNSSSASNGQNNGSNLPNNEPNNIPSPVNRKPKTVKPHKTFNKGFNIKDQNAIHNQQLANRLKNNGSSSNAQNNASNTLPQTGNDKHSSLAMLALGSLALATALGAAWFGRKKD